jgi:hypothetical protein
MREFTTAAEAVETTGDTFGKEVTIKIDGREVRFLPATEGQLAMVIGSDAVPLMQKISTAINFFFGLVRDGRDADYFKQRLFDRADPFGAEQITAIVEALIEEWTGNPTQSSSDSTGSQDDTGAPSTPSAPQPGSTLSPSDLTGSAT